MSSISAASETKTLRVPKESWMNYQSTKCVVAFLFALFTLMLNAGLIILVHQRLPFGMTELPDLVFEMFPLWNQAMVLSESYIMISNFLLATMMVFHPAGGRICQRYFVVIGICYFMRAVCLGTTQFPMTEYYVSVRCSPRVGNKADLKMFFTDAVITTLAYIPSLGAEIWRNSYQCGEYFFSGHTIQIFTTYFFLKKYFLQPKSRSSSKLWSWASRILFCIAWLAAVLIVVARAHYLVDIVVGYYVVSRIFSIYHFLASHENLYEEESWTMLAQYFWWPIFLYLEWKPERQRTRPTITKQLPIVEKRR